MTKEGQALPKQISLNSFAAYLADAVQGALPFLNLAGLEDPLKELLDEPEYDLTTAQTGEGTTVYHIVKSDANPLRLPGRSGGSLLQTATNIVQTFTDKVHAEAVQKVLPVVRLPGTWTDAHGTGVETKDVGSTEHSPSSGTAGSGATSVVKWQDLDAITARDDFSELLSMSPTVIAELSAVLERDLSNVPLADVLDELLRPKPSHEDPRKLRLVLAHDTDPDSYGETSVWGWDWIATSDQHKLPTITVSVAARSAHRDPIGNAAPRVAIKNLIKLVEVFAHELHHARGIKERQMFNEAFGPGSDPPAIGAKLSREEYILLHLQGEFECRMHTRTVIAEISNALPSLRQIPVPSLWDPTEEELRELIASPTASYLSNFMRNYDGPLKNQPPSVLTYRSNASNADPTDPSVGHWRLRTPSPGDEPSWSYEGLTNTRSEWRKAGLLWI